MSERRAKLLSILREPLTDPEGAHSRAETALMEYFDEIDPELSQAWATARDIQEWWYS
jgi:hypothetical protein